MEIGGEVQPDNKRIVGSSSSGTTNLGSFSFSVPTVSTDTTYKIKFFISAMETPDFQSIPDETNTATITVKAPIPDPPPAPVDTRSTNANLSDLGINPKEYDFKTFTGPNRTSHTATVPNEVEEVEVWYKQADTKSTVSITAGSGLKVNNGKVSGLKVGTNKITVTVTAEAGNTKKYTITVTRKEAGATVEPPVDEPPVEEPEVPEEPTDTEVTESGEGIEKLTIAGITLKPKFSTDVYEYEAVLEEDINTLKIDTKTTSNDYRVVVAGNENLKNGENLITLIVYDAKNTVVATYQITVMKNTIDQNEINSIFGQIKKEEMIKTIAIISVLVLIVILIIIYAIIKVKMKKTKNKTNKEEDIKDNDIDIENNWENDTKNEVEQNIETENVIKTENNTEDYMNFEDIMGTKKAESFEDIMGTKKTEYFEDIIGMTKTDSFEDIYNIGNTKKIEDYMKGTDKIEDYMKSAEKIERIERIEDTKTLEEKIEDILQSDKKKGKHF